jgi:hypothetical protein
MFTLPVFHRNTSWVEKNRMRMLRPVGTLRADPKRGLTWFKHKPINCLSGEFRLVILQTDDCKYSFHPGFSIQQDLPRVNRWI